MVKVYGPIKYTRPFIIDGETFAEVVHNSSANGPLTIDICMNVTLSITNARKFLKWLPVAIDEVIEDRKIRKDYGLEEYSDQY